MPDNPTNTNDVLQSHAHSTLSAEEIAKAVARHNREHKSGQQHKPQAQPKPKKGK